MLVPLALSDGGLFHAHGVPVVPETTARTGMTSVSPYPGLKCICLQAAGQFRAEVIKVSRRLVYVKVDLGGPSPVVVKALGRHDVSGRLFLPRS